MNLETKHKPIITHMYSADPSVRVFDGRIYIYPSHDLDHDNPENDKGDHFDMEDYHVFSMQDMDSPVRDHGQILHIDNVPWASRQMWAPDAAQRNGRYYFYFPAKDDAGIFRIGAAVSEAPTGPFVPQPEPIPGSYSIDPCVFTDDAGQSYMYFGGLWGGQLEKWRTGQFNASPKEMDPQEPAVGLRVVKMNSDMLSFAGPAREVMIYDENGKVLKAGDTARRAFEGPWMHRYNGVYYFSYSTGDTHYIAYATGNSPLGPFTFRGYILNPVIGWTTQHSIIEFKGNWYLFYHDSSLSGGETNKRCVKVCELFYNTDGSIQTINP